MLREVLALCLHGTQQRLLSVQCPDVTNSRSAAVFSHTAFLSCPWTWQKRAPLHGVPPASWTPLPRCNRHQGSLPALPLPVPLLLPGQRALRGHIGWAEPHQPQAGSMRGCAREPEPASGCLCRGAGTKPCNWTWASRACPGPGWEGRERLAAQTGTQSRGSPGGRQCGGHCVPGMGMGQALLTCSARQSWAGSAAESPAAVLSLPLSLRSPAEYPGGHREQ